MSIAIVGSSGGMKGVFVQGVFEAFETESFHADAYAGASASALPTVSAAARLCNYVGVRYWQRVQTLLAKPGNDLSHVMRTVTREWDAPDEPFTARLFRPAAARLFIPANFVKSPEAAAQTQSSASRRLGRRLLLDIARKDRRWVDVNLELHMFDTQAPAGAPRLTPDNIADVSYASTRMIHWQVPAWIEGKPYVDASYTCACPAAEMVARGYTEVIAISTETGALYRDIFCMQPIPDVLEGTPVRVVRPDFDLKTLGVDFTTCTREGLLAAFEHGVAKGREFLARRRTNIF